MIQAQLFLNAVILKKKYTVILNDIWIQESEDMETYNEHEIIHITSLLQNHNNNEPTEDMKTLLFNKTIYLKK